MVTINEIAVALGRAQPSPDSLEAMQWDMWVRDAEWLIQSRLTQLNMGSITGLDQTGVAYVVREAVVEMAQRAGGADQIDVAVDDARVSRRWSTPKKRVEISDELWAKLLPSASGSGAFSIRPGFVADRC